MSSLPTRLHVSGRAITLGWARTEEGTPALLSENERALLGPGAKLPRVRQFVAGRLAARRALASLGLEAEVLRTPAGAEDAGRPFVAGLGAPPVAISLTHSGTLACAAVAEGTQPLGIDLEAEALEAAPSFLEEAFAPGELDGFRPFEAWGLDPLRAAWTLKEAVLKVWGVGLRVPLTRLQLQPVDLTPCEGWVACRIGVCFRGPNPPLPWMLGRVRRVDGAVLSVALPT